MADYDPWGHKESDTTEQLILSLSPTLVRVLVCKMPPYMESKERLKKEALLQAGLLLLFLFSC